MRADWKLFLACLVPLSGFAESNPKLPEPYATKSVSKPGKVSGWPKGKTPVPAPGFAVETLAELKSPRFLYLLPSGDVLVAQANKGDSPNRITRLRLEGSRLLGPPETFLDNLNMPFGIALWKNELFVAEPSRVLRYRYENGKTQGPPVEIAQLPYPDPKRHWTRGLLMKPDGSKLYVSVGSPSDAGESPDPLHPHAAAILEMNRDGTELKVFAGGLRNAATMAWEPVTQALWAAVNERDELGDNLVPDYITRVQSGGWYGWPYTYWGNRPDPRLKGDPQKRSALVPDFAVGAHTASLGITFTGKTNVPPPFDEGALIAQHGSWNSSKLVGYQVHYVAFRRGRPVNEEKPFLTGFISGEKEGIVYGRPVHSVVLKDGAVLVSDDGGDRIWVVRPTKKAP